MRSDPIMTASNPVPITTLEDRDILVIEDDPDIAELLTLHLRDQYLKVEIANDGRLGFELARSRSWDLIILDLRLPGMDGLELCRRLRGAGYNVPILMLTSKSSELDHVLGLEMGADDYVTKPFSVMELSARIKAIFRRVEISVSRADKHDALLNYQDIAVDTSKREVRVGGKEIELTAKEFDLLAFFVKYPGEVFSRAQLLDKVWGYGHQGYEHTVNSHINRLRAKIEKAPAQPEYLVTVWGVGYKLRES